MTREELYELVWSEPVIKAARRFGISSVALAKRCRREGIPLPPRGYWARIVAGQRIPKPELPPRPVKAPVARSAKELAATVRNREPKPERKFHRYKSRLSREDRLETFWCEIDRSQRFYSFGVNWRPWEFNEESWSEHDRVELTASIRSKTLRPYRSIEMWLWPTHVHRDHINRELDAIGNVWTNREKKGWLFCGAHIPSDAFYSLCDALARKDFAEVSVEVRNLKRGHGKTSDVAFRPELTDLSDD